jgi:Thioredoxin like C-terminal domain
VIRAVNASGAEAASDAKDDRSPETYIGYVRAEHFASPGGIAQGTAHVYTVGTPALNQWGLTGGWTVAGDRATLDEPDGGIVFRFHARDLHLVLGPAPDGKPMAPRPATAMAWTSMPRDKAS